MTDAERAVWNILRGRQMEGTYWRRQHPIGPYIADFACIERKLVIEVDGGQHNEEAEGAGDAQRTAYLNSRGFCVLRFWDNEALTNIEGVAAVIRGALGAE
ncbi:MAG: endonuclease domain-containing protein [Chloroflexi bacterium]|nr:endonuclease domain-containing protein [Chloroflexota bacterium]